MRVVVLGGGDSLERDVSLRSAKSVQAALETAGYKTGLVDIGLVKPDYSKFLGHEIIVFPILHGAGGEDGEIQKILEQAKLPYLGTDSKNSKICFDKWLTRRVLEKAGLPMAIGVHVTKDTYRNQPLALRPHVLKAVGGGSSIGTYIVRDPTKLHEAQIDGVFVVSTEAVLEELVEGVEITVPVLDGKALPIIEIIPPINGEFDYENKYNGKTQEICPPISIDSVVLKKAQELGERAHIELGCRHFSRVDMIVRPNGSIVILEINTIPGMTDQSLFPKSAEVAGYTFPELMKKFVKMVLRDE